MALLKSAKISYCVILLFMAATSSVADFFDGGVQVTGKVGESPSVVYAGAGKDLKLICDAGKKIDAGVEPYWSFANQAKTNHTDMVISCPGKDAKKKTKKKKGQPKPKRTLPFSDCKIDFEEGRSWFTIKLEDVVEDEFGDYACHIDSQNSSRTFNVQEIPTLTRLSESGKPQKSVTLTEGEPLDLYCNATGLREWHVRTWWWEEGDDKLEAITDDLRKGSGLFENFTGSDLSYNGISRLDQRGHYICQVDLDASKFPREKESDLHASIAKYPITYKYFVRVKKIDTWKLPLYVLLGEVAAIGLFTVIINIKEKRASEEEADGQYEDSDDEDEVPATQNGNGVQNNNGSNRGK